MGSWAERWIAKLKEGETVRFRPRGNSMSGTVNDGDLVEVEPAVRFPVAGDVVLCRVGGRHYLHFCSAVRGDRFRISNARGHVNGWVGRKDIHGILTSIVR